MTPHECERDNSSPKAFAADPRTWKKVGSIGGKNDAVCSTHYDSRLEIIRRPRASIDESDMDSKQKDHNDKSNHAGRTITFVLR